METERTWLSERCRTSVEGLDVIQCLVNFIQLVASLLQNWAGTEHRSMGLHVLEREMGDIQVLFYISFHTVTISTFYYTQYNAYFSYPLHVKPNLRGSQASVGKPQFIQVGHRLLSCTGLQRGQFLS